MDDAKNTFEDLRAWILKLSEVSESPHRFGGIEFKVGGIEFMHSHGHSWLDIRLSKEDQTSVLETGEALRHRFAPQAGWVSFKLNKQEDLVNVRKIIRLAYENAKKNLEDVKSRRAQLTLR